MQLIFEEKQTRLAPEKDQQDFVAKEVLPDDRQ
jgi:hypothetical protein